MKINPKNLIIPPFISTSWKQVKSIFVSDGTLKISLQNGETVNIPNLSDETLTAVFKAHEDFLESEQPKPSESEELSPKEFIQGLFSNLPISDIQLTSFSPGGIEGISAVLQHDLSQSNSPKIPDEILNRIASLVKMMMPEDGDALPKPEPHCNCPHCQIARAIRGTELEEEVDHDEPVEDEELEFKEWDVESVGENLYRVTSRLNPQEQYQVYLGEPVGCTCGKEGCDHLLAVLRS